VAKIHLIELVGLPYINPPVGQRCGVRAWITSRTSAHKDRLSARGRAAAALVRTFHGIFYAEQQLCERKRGRQVVGTPRIGCAFWEREPGSDDERREGRYRIDVIRRVAYCSC